MRKCVSTWKRAWPRILLQPTKERKDLKKEQSISDQIWQFFCSVQLAVYTLVLLAATSVIGTVILQNGTPQQYLREYGPQLYNIIKVFDFDDMYHAWWFLALIMILCINIVVCSIERLSNTWKIIFPKKVSFSKDRFRKLKNIESFSMASDRKTLADRFGKVMGKRFSTILTEETENTSIIYAEKNRWTRFGVYIVHVSILFLLIGALLGAMFGFKAHLNLDEGKSSTVAFRSKTNAPIPLGFEIRCDDFDVQFYDTGSPKEFKSILTVLKGGKEIFTEEIRVNHPLRYKGINIFQASYGTVPSDQVVLDIVRLSDNTVITKEMKVGDAMDLPDGQGRFLLEGFSNHSDFRNQDLGPAFIGKVIPVDGEAFNIQLPLRFSKFDRMRKGTFAFVINKTVEKHFTGLQITRDPGVWYVYVGFILMILGCWITFFMSHQSFMIEIQSSEKGESMVSLSGTSNRNSQGIKLKINKLIHILKG